MSKRKRKTVDAIVEAAEPMENTELTLKPEVYATLQDTPKSDLKTEVRKLIEQAPTLQTVIKDPWAYTEWLARLNTAAMQP